MITFVRLVLWTALTGTTAFFVVLLLLFPVDGEVAGLIVVITMTALAIGWMLMCSWVKEPV